MQTSSKKVKLKEAAKGDWIRLDVYLINKKNGGDQKIELYGSFKEE